MKSRTFPRRKTQQTRAVSFTVSAHDFELAKNMARRKGVHYKAFIADVLHKYANGRLAEKSS